MSDMTNDTGRLDDPENEGRNDERDNEQNDANRTDEGAQDQQKDAENDVSEPQAGEGDQGFVTSEGHAAALQQAIDDNAAQGGGEVEGMLRPGEDPNDRETRSSQPVHRIEPVKESNDNERSWAWRQVDAEGNVVAQSDFVYGSQGEAVAAAPSTFTSRNEVQDGPPTYRTGDITA